MNFPTDEDIKRILDMQSSDCGFFVLAIYLHFKTCYNGFNR